MKIEKLMEIVDTLLYIIIHVHWHNSAFGDNVGLSRKFYVTRFYFSHSNKSPANSALVVNAVYMTVSQ